MNTRTHISTGTPHINGKAIAPATTVTLTFRSESEAAEVRVEDVRVDGKAYRVTAREGRTLFMTQHPPEPDLTPITAAASQQLRTREAHHAELAKLHKRHARRRKPA